MRTPNNLKELIESKHKYYNRVFTIFDDISNEAVTTTIANGEVVNVIREPRFKYEESIGKR